MTICSEKSLRSSAHCRTIITRVKKKRNYFYVRSGLILRTTTAFIMETEYANDSNVSEDEELNIPALALPYQFELLRQHS